MHKVIVNSTPIISLCHIGKLGLLKELYGEVLIPEAVYREISAKHDSIAKAELDNSLDWIRVCKIQNEMARFFFKSQLHDGEVEVMILGKEEKATLLIIDDKNAKNHAKYLKFNVTGTLGVLLKAKREGRIDTIKPLLDKMVSEGIFLDAKAQAYCLKEAGE
jgi:predicted nucleic acid-binding protein